jgi:hypothetical protein
LNLSHFIIDLAENALAHPDKYMRPGHNGPYHDPETPVRNFGHWLITFAKCYEWTGERKFRDKVDELATYLCSQEARPRGFSFHHRNKAGKDKCNGLIGQAWTIEALATASACCENRSYADVAREVFCQHEFSDQHGLWKVLEIDGQTLGIDMAFNHQLWFAACASLIKTNHGGSALIEERVRKFLNRMLHNMEVLDNGCIYHPIEWVWSQRFEETFSFKRQMTHAVGTLWQLVCQRKLASKCFSKTEMRRDARKKMTYKSLGYHGFNMYAFALLRQQVPEDAAWTSPEFKRAVRFMTSPQYWRALDTNKYGYPYNPPGFELPFAMNVLTEMNQEELVIASQRFINEQLKRCYDSEARMMCDNTEDALTHSARVYEVTRRDSDVLKEIQVS